MNSTPYAMNSATDERRLNENIDVFLAYTLNCSSLIDVLHLDYYNIFMEDNNVISLIAFDVSEPKRKINRSPGAIYTALIALIIGVISLANLLDARWNIPRYLVQPALYVIIAVGAIYVYLHYFVSFRYTLTDELIAVEKVAGKKETTILVTSLNTITEISRYDKKQKKCFSCTNASVQSKRNTTCITITQDGKDVMYCIASSEEFLEKLTAQWQIAKAQKE